jgi:hypothetical protein
MQAFEHYGGCLHRLAKAPLNCASDSIILAAAGDVTLGSLTRPESSPLGTIKSQATKTASV